MAATSTNSTSTDRQWFIAGRWQEFEGEGRAGLLRILTIAVFYVVQLLQYHVLVAAEDRDPEFHQAATALAVAGSLISLAFLLCLRRRMLPALLKFGSVACDVILVTSAAALGAGPNSPVIYAFYLLIALAALRFSLRLIWCATLGSMAGYLLLVGMYDDVWFDARHVVPPVQQIMMLVSLALTGIVLGQVIRRVRWVAEDYARRMAATTGNPT